ncbi:MAG: aminotransferase class I/II-fold pyridoxal phosphate-dependent enzyme [Myxococcota bacterium]|nr:aminotransferase class I/II-fold pyridoxal phosphate-dependent enzyme [Myxococcota bacterium]MEC8381530.1 aminotransferase class I/II-fold pyridoxal phosphate-dependent enzyme [Myxococcota bacterium]
MSIDVQSVLGPQGADHFVTPTMATMKGSAILGIAAQVRGLIAEGREICNLTVGDFRPNYFPIPESLAADVKQAYNDGETNYPPSDGIPELKAAISDLYKSRLGVDYGPNAVCVASGARPPLYAVWRLFVDPGDRSISFLPAWNNGYYAHMTRANHEFIPTTAESNFHPTVKQVEEALPGTVLMATNTPLNPTGTAIDKSVLEGIARAVVNENKRRGVGEKPVMWLYDQVYWLLKEEGVEHFSPVALVPEVAPYVIHVDAISKSFAATGLRVGWAVLPPVIQAKMKALIGHMGAWAARPEQVATARLLRNPEAIDTYLAEMQSRVSTRLQLLYSGLMRLKASGLPVDAIAPQGAIYLSCRFDLIGQGFDSNEAIRHWLLESAGIAIVPFQAFDLQENSGWFRMSIGAASIPELESALVRLEQAIRTHLQG